MPAPTYVSGDRKVAMFAVDSSTVIAKGDLLYQDTNDVKPLTSLSDSGTKSQNQAAARNVFTGVALRSSPDGSSLPIPVALGGVFEFDCSSSTFEIGDLVGPIGTGSGSAVGVSATNVESVASGSLAIGKVFRRNATAATRVAVEIFTVSSANPIDTTTSFETASFSSSISVDAINEYSAAAGVNIDGAVLKDAGATLSGNLLVGGTDVATIKGFYLSGTVAVAVPTIANDAAENVDSVAVDVSAMTFAPAVGDAVIAIPSEALPTDCLQLGAYVTATDQVTISYGSKEGGGGVTGANKNYKFLFIDLT